VGEPPAGLCGGLFRHPRTTRTTRPNPKKSAAKGTIQAVRLNPVVVGAASTVGPYFCTKACCTKLSLSPRATCAANSLRMPSESGQPTWLHSRRIWLQPQMHMIWWPRSVKRVAGSPAPEKTKTARQRTSAWTILPGWDCVRFEFVIGLGIGTYSISAA